MKSHNLIIPGFLALSLLCMLVFSLRCKLQTGEKNSKGLLPLRDCPEEFTRKRRMWYIGWVWWLYTTYMVLFLGFISSMIVLYINAMSIGTKSETILYSIVAAFMTVFNYVVSPKRYMKACRRAYTILDKALFSFVYMNKTDDITTLVLAEQTGEEYISNSAITE